MSKVLKLKNRILEKMKIKQKKKLIIKIYERRRRRSKSCNIVKFIVMLLPLSF